MSVRSYETTSVDKHSFMGVPNSRYPLGRMTVVNVSMAHILISLVVGLLVVLGLDTAHAQSTQCPELKARRAEIEAPSLTTWDTLYASYREFRHCDDGVVSSGYTESVVRILRDYWDDLAQFQRLARSDGDFEKFVFKHIGMTALAGDLDLVAKSAEERCPRGMGDLCSRIKREALKKE
jgi:hypothetical protein